MSPAEIARAYDAVAEAYAAARSLQIGIDPLRAFTERLTPGSRILDIGCGTGVPLTRELVGQGFRVHGIDPAPRMLDHARANVPGATFQQAEITSWRPAESFDGVLAYDSLFHLRPAAQRSALETIRAALAPGGIAVLSFGGVEGELNGEMFGRTFYYGSLSRSTYASILQTLGLEVLDIVETHPDEPHIVVTVERPK
jgi:SAM-dependent methyltransferase